MTNSQRRSRCSAVRYSAWSVYMTLCACGPAEPSAGDQMTTTGGAGSDASAHADRSDGSEREAGTRDGYASDEDVATSQVGEAGDTGATKNGVTFRGVLASSRPITT